MIRSLSLDTAWPTGLAWHPDGKRLAAGGSDYQVYLWNADTGELQAVLKGHQAEVIHVQFSRGGELLVSASWDQTTRLWEPGSGQLLVTAWGTALSFGPDDRWLSYLVSNHTAGIWEVTTGRGCLMLHSHPGPEKMPWHITFSPDARLLASVGTDGVRFWDPTTGKEAAWLPTTRKVWSALFHPDGNSLLLSGTFGLHRLPIERDPATPDRIRISPPQPIWKRGLGRACLSADGRILAATAGPAQVIVLDLEKQGEPILLEKHLGEEIAPVISPDGRWVATGVWRGKGVKVWEARTGKLVQDLPAPGVHSRAFFSPDGVWLATSTGRDYSFWQVSSWQPGLTLKRENAGGLAGPLAFAPDGKLLAITYAPGRVHLIDRATGQRLAKLEATTPAHLDQLAFSPDGTRLAASSNGSHLILIWDLRRVRQTLAALNLDWDLPPYPPADPSASQPLQVEVVGQQG
jgi:WD40 repeat protein